MTTSSVALPVKTKGRSATAPDGIEVSKTIEGLQVVNNPDVALAIWRRSLPAHLRVWLDRLDPSELPDVRLLVRPADLHRALQPLLDEAGMPNGPMRDLLVGDISTLVQLFADIVRTDLIDVRFERISHDACWKFHRDCVDARLLTTYRGATSEWVHPSDSEAAISQQKSFLGPIQRLAADDVAIFLGSCAGPGTGIVHRSPPVAGTGETRLLLCLNKPSVTSPDQWPAPA
ncbi:DUF1826 domain-containing protein [Pelagibius sp. Alg239-R121]|uniref:DUF1826 domain-containing protein n=1 Tax=Pelagibius sp. Alg239-R121 TaxID=2993448 RepID=UPI0024A65D49|nr:DUF1826 domain-containing protein [Pelagibius sp. Alg239-R121]